MMQHVPESFGLYTDFYELTMAQGYYFCGKGEQIATFDYFFRTNPFNGGFTVFAGISDFLEILSKFTFSPQNINYLKEQGLHPEFLGYLKKFSFKGSIYSMKEGEIIFPNEPILRVEGNLIECQLIETMLLNILNFESLIATKAFRIRLVSGDKIFSDFGMRRAQGLGAIHASRAAFIGGASSTSNVLAGEMYGIPLSGTMAHSWVQSFDSEHEAFSEYARIHPDNTILLVDTYDTLKSGIPNAIKVAKDMEGKGHRLRGIRLDSGDLAFLSSRARKMLDEAGLGYVEIIASNQLNEEVIKSLLKEQDAKIDAFGIGTELVTGKPSAALDGVYKLAEIGGFPKMKISENTEKTTLPGKKLAYRIFDGEGIFFRDAILLGTERPEDVGTIYHPAHPEKNTPVDNLKFEPLLHKIVDKGKVEQNQQNLVQAREYLKQRAELLPYGHKRFISPHLYKVGISGKLMEMRNSLATRVKTNK